MLSTLDLDYDNERLSKKKGNASQKEQQPIMS